MATIDKSVARGAGKKRVKTRVKGVSLLWVAQEATKRLFSCVGNAIQLLKLGTKLGRMSTDDVSRAEQILLALGEGTAKNRGGSKKSRVFDRYRVCA